jgi:hypothetical protein
MMKGTLVFTLSFLMLLSTPGLLTAQEADEEADEALKEKTVMITVNFSKGQPAEYGTGVVLCQENDRAWILTANHVFAGKSSEPWKQLRLRRIEHATIAFYHNSPPAIEADTTVLRKEMSFYTFRPEDLLLLSVPLTQKLPSTATLSPPPSDADEQHITAQGYWKDKGLTWSQVAGELAASREGSTRFLYHTGEVHEGFSGGPLFNQLGELIGINLQRVPGELTPGGTSGEWYGKAQMLNNKEVLSVMDKWMPSKCLESASQLSELAFYVYKKAMRAVSIRSWAEAEELMRQAIAQKSTGGGSVHLEGMRYTRYLPHYHLGLALLKQGNYSDAIREFDRSEAQGVIQDDKRYTKLKRHRLRAYEELRRQAVTAAPAT